MCAAKRPASPERGSRQIVDGSYLLRLMRPENGLRFLPALDLRLLLEILPKLLSLGLEMVPLLETELRR